MWLGAVLAGNAAETAVTDAMAGRAEAFKADLKFFADVSAGKLADGVSRADLETWLRPASLVGREGDALIVGAPNAVARDRIANRLLPALRRALAGAIGVALDVIVQTEEQVAQSERGAAG